MVNISVIGSGYVGLVTGACLAEFGHQVTCMDVDESKIRRLQQGVIPIYEPGLEELIRSNCRAGRLCFTTDMAAAVRDGDVLFIAVGTPPQQDGSADLQYVLEAARTIALHMDAYRVIVDKSTVPVGTGRRVIDEMALVLRGRGMSADFDVVSNPEFLREGAAIGDFTHPKRVVIGTSSKRARNIMESIYRAGKSDCPFVFTDRETAEMIKYASNAFLATKISFINEVSRLCEKVGANVLDVAYGMGLDTRIGSHFLNVGPGFGGSCFPKDTKALNHIAEENGCAMPIIHAVIDSDRQQKHHMADKISGEMGSLQGKVIAILGLSFKPETDDIRESPAISVATELLRRGAKLRVYDPMAMENARRFALADSVYYAADTYDCAQGADAVVVLTEWEIFRNLDFSRLAACARGRYFFDLRNIYTGRESAAAGFRYIGVGTQPVA